VKKPVALDQRCPCIRRRVSPRGKNASFIKSIMMPLCQDIFMLENPSKSPLVKNGAVWQGEKSMFLT
jgi:hypothetical protein